MAEQIDSQLKQMAQDLKEIIEQMNASNTAQEEDSPVSDDTIQWSCDIVWWSCDCHVQVPRAHDDVIFIVEGGGRACNCQKFEQVYRISYVY